MTRVLLDEADLIDELIDVVMDQRDSIKSGNYAEMQELMKHVQDVFFRVQSQDSLRARLVESTAKDLSCAPRVSAIAEALPEEERPLFNEAGERLEHVVFALKAEMTILGGLIEQSERLGAMLLSEWRRLDAGFMRSGGLDFRG